MFYVKNLPMWERSLRIGAGIAVAAYAAFSMGGILGWAVAAGGGRCGRRADWPVWVLPRLCAGATPFGKAHPARLSADG